MPAITTRNDAVNYVEARLGPDATRALAEAFCTVTRWQTVDKLTDEEWDDVLRLCDERDGEALRKLNGET